MLIPEARAVCKDPVEKYLDAAVKPVKAMSDLPVDHVVYKDSRIVDLALA